MQNAVLEEPVLGLIFHFRACKDGSSSSLLRLSSPEMTLQDSRGLWSEELFLGQDSVCVFGLQGAHCDFTAPAEASPGNPPGRALLPSLFLPHFLQGTKQKLGMQLLELPGRTLQPPPRGEKPKGNS